MSNTYRNSVSSSTKISQNDVDALVARLQNNLEQVAENVYRTEELLEEDSENGSRGKTLTRRIETARILTENETLLKELYIDLDRVMKLQYPELNDLEYDVSSLHNRWSQCCALYQDLYKQSLNLDLSSHVDWPQLLSIELNHIQRGDYGPSLADVERQMTAHKVLQKEIETYGPRINSTELNKLYSRLMDECLSRKRDLSTLYEYMVSCNKEMAFLTEQQNRIRKTNWSDLIRDLSGVTTEHERLRSTGLRIHESEVNRLRAEAEVLLQKQHPGSYAFNEHNDSLQKEWHRFFKLYECQGIHLNNLELYKKYQLDSEMISESLKRISSTMEQSLLNNMSNSQIHMQLEGEERGVQRNERRLAELRELCRKVPPLPMRRAQYTRCPVVALCDWSEASGSVYREDRYSLVSSPKEENWEVKDSRGETKVIPGVCFVIPPPDNDAIERVEGLEREFASLKRRRESLRASVRTPTEEVVRVVQTVTVSSVPDSSQGNTLNTRLDRLISDLLQLEKDVLGRLRTHLDRADRTGDLATRTRGHERAVSTLKNLESEKASIQREIEPLLSRSSLSPENSSLPPKLSIAKNKIEDLNALTDLYGKKVNAVLQLENQIKKVDLSLVGIKDQLCRDAVILDKYDALDDHIYKLEKVNLDVLEKHNGIQKLNRDLELTEQLCDHLKERFQEYCPDIRRQETEVRALRDRYSNINNQIRQRMVLLKEADHKFHSFQSAVSSLNKYLSNLPNNKVHSEDSMTLINNKKNSQKLIVAELKRKSEDVDHILTLSREVQNILKQYEALTYKYCCTVGDVKTHTTKWNSLTLAEALQNRERNVVNRYKQTLGENIQLLDQMELAKNMINKHETIINRVVVYQQKEMDNVDNLKKDLADEISRRIHVENELETYRSRMMSLRTRRGIERVEEKETVQYYRDSKLEADLEMMKKKIDEEILRHAKTHAEIEIINKKIITVEHEVTNIVPKLITKVTTEYSRDPQLETEMILIREHIRKIREEIRMRETEIVQSKTEITFWENKKLTIVEKVVKKEVVKIEKDPEMLRAVIKFREEISAFSATSKTLSDEIFHIRSQINTLERLIPTIQPKVVVKEVKKVEQDATLLKEVSHLRTSLEEIRQEISILIKEISILQVQYTKVETITQKIEVRETVNEVYRIDPETEIELRRLRKEIQEWVKQRVEIENKTSLLMVDIKTLRSQKPRVEVQEVVREVVKEERSPEIIRELARLKEHLTLLRETYRTKHEKLTIISREREEWRIEKSKIETKIVTREVIRYENDPLLEKEARRLRQEVEEAIRLTLSVQENITDLRQKYLVLENQKHQEKIVYEEVVILQKDEKQIIEHERLVKRLEEERRARHLLEVEVQKLRTLVLEMEKSVSLTEVRQQRILIETEVRKIRTRIVEFESAPPPPEKIIIEEVVRVERDSNIDKLMKGLQIEFDSESSKTVALQRDIQNLKLRVEVLTKEKSIERTVHKEVIRYEKDHAVEAERIRLREELAQLRMSLKIREEDIVRVRTKLTRIETTVTTFTKEETTLTQNISMLRKEREELLRELKRLETERHEINITFQHESKLLSERTHSYKQRMLKLESEIETLEKYIFVEKEKIQQKEILIIELTNKLKKEDHSGNHTIETTKSTKITILDPETGKDLSAYEAYRQGLIDREHYLHLQTLECSWEEVTNTTAEGETTVLLDRKSGNKYSIEEALLSGKLTKYDLQKYKEGKMSISEFALMVAGDNMIKSSVTSMLPPMSPVKNSSSSLHNYSSTSHSSLKVSRSLSTSTPTLYIPREESSPISGVVDTTSKSRLSLRSAMTRKLIDPDTAEKLLEAQAATGGIVDIIKKERYSVHKAAGVGLIDPSQMPKLVSAQKAFTGVEDPATKQRLSVGQAAQKGWISYENAKRYMEAQVLTGGLVDPNRAGRMSIEVAVLEKMIDQQTAEDLQDDRHHLRELVDPITKSKMTYKEAMAKCKKDESTGLLLLPVASTDTTDSGSYSRSSHSGSSYSGSSYSYSYSTSSLPH